MLPEVLERITTLESGYALEVQGLSVTRELDRTEWINCGKEIVRRVEGSTWALGDWLIYGGRKEKDWLGGSTYERAVEITGYSAAHLSNAFRVATAFPRDTRWPTLSWSVHREATRAPQELRGDILRKAEEMKWGADDVIVYVNKLITVAKEVDPEVKTKEKKPHRSYYSSPKVRCPACNNEFTIKGHKVKSG